MSLFISIVLWVLLVSHCFLVAQYIRQQKQIAEYRALISDSVAILSQTQRVLKEKNAKTYLRSAT